MKKYLILFLLLISTITGITKKGEDNSPISPIKHTVSVYASDGGSVVTG